MRVAEINKQAKMITAYQILPLLLFTQSGSSSAHCLHLPENFIDITNNKKATPSHYLSNTNMGETRLKIDVYAIRSTLQSFETVNKPSPRNSRASHSLQCTETPMPVERLHQTAAPCSNSSPASPDWRVNRPKQTSSSISADTSLNKGQ